MGAPATLFQLCTYLWKPRCCLLASGGGELKGAFTPGLALECGFLTYFHPNLYTSPAEALGDYWPLPEEGDSRVIGLNLELGLCLGFNNHHKGLPG